MHFSPFMVFWHSSRNPTPDRARVFQCRHDAFWLPLLTRLSSHKWISIRIAYIKQNNTLCHWDCVQFLWACGQANWPSHGLFLSIVSLCEPGCISVHCPQAVDVLSWLTLVHQLTPPKHSSVVDLQGVYQLKTAWQGGWFMIDPEKCWSPYTASQATLAECLRET